MVTWGLRPYHITKSKPIHTDCVFLGQLSMDLKTLKSRFFYDLLERAYMVQIWSLSVHINVLGKYRSPIYQKPETIFLIWFVVTYHTLGIPRYLLTFDTTLACGRSVQAFRIGVWWGGAVVQRVLWALFPRAHTRKQCVAGCCSNTDIFRYFSWFIV